MKTLRILFGTMIIAISGCGGSNDPLETVNNYDQSVLLNNLGDNLILPAYRDLKNSAEKLEITTDDFVSSPDLAALEMMREALKETRIAYQWVTPYQFGPAEQFALNSELNLFPADKNQIESNIASGTYDLSVLSNQDARGFQAVAYLIYGEMEDDTLLLESFDEARLTYLKELVNRISFYAGQVESAWSPSGQNYLDDFKSRTGVDAGSSVGILVNSMNQNFERNTRDGKIGIPIGIRTMGEPVPQNIEARYAGYSTELLDANLLAYQYLYEGKARDGTDSEGFNDYLSQIGALDASNQELHEKISSQWNTIIAEADRFTDPLDNEIQNRQTELEDLFAEMQKMVVFMKTDLSSALGVVISYQDNDGD